MANIDPQRRRLTVAPGQGGAMQDPGAGGASGAGQKGPDLLAYLNDAHKEGKRAVCLSSTTDRAMAKTASFTEKQQDMLIPDGADPALLQRWVEADLGIAVACKKGCKPESPNQDSYSILAIEGEYVLFGVYDGHGPNGHDVSEFVRIELPRLLLDHDGLIGDTGKAFEECFVACQDLIEGERSMDSSRSGTTCSMALWNMQTNVVTVAHAGDSRCVLGASEGNRYKTEDLTVDHKPNLPEEKKRIESAKPPGRVVFDGFYNHRVFAQGGMYPGLNMSRALGDVVAHKEAGLTAFPDVKSFCISDKMPTDGGSLTLALCTDGVWEFLESADAFDRIKVGQPLQPCAEKLTKDSYDAWMKDSDGEISDDITAILVNFPK